MRSIFVRDGSPAPAGLLLLTGVAIVIATVVLLPHDMSAFGGRAEYNLWRVAIAIQWTLWLAGSLYAGTVIDRHGLRGSIVDAVVLAAVVAGTGFLATQNRICPELLPSRLHTALTAIAIAGLFATGVVAVASWSNAAAIRRVTEPREFLSLRAESSHLLTMLGLSLTAATIGAGLFVRAVNAAVQCNVPAESVVAYGLIYSLLLAVVWLPNFLAISHRGPAIVGAIEGVDQTAPLTLERLEKRTKIGAALQLNNSVLDQLKAAAYILAPLLSSVMALALPAKK